MINRNKSELPKNYHLSIAKMIDDVFVAGFADLYEGFTELDPIIPRQFHVKNICRPDFQQCDPSTFEFNESRVFDIMETTQFLNDTALNLDHWPIWKIISTVFESNDRSGDINMWIFTENFHMK